VFVIFLSKNTLMFIKDHYKGGMTYRRKRKEEDVDLSVWRMRLLFTSHITHLFRI